jgi:hypothetical protein
MLKYLSNLPIIALGDFNIPFKVFQESDWPTRLNVKMIHPGVETTTSQSLNRVIDYGFISLEIETMFISIRPLFSIPCHPHIGLLVELHGNPREISGLVQCIPRKLPMKEFGAEWSKLQEHQHFQKWFSPPREPDMC